MAIGSGQGASGRHHAIGAQAVNSKQRANFAQERILSLRYERLEAQRIKAVERQAEARRKREAAKKAAQETNGN